MNTFGRIFRISLFGESHGNSVGVLIDGCPAGIPLTESDFEKDLSRRKSGAKGTTPRIEFDIPRLMAGVFDMHTTGAPILILFENSNTRSGDYLKFRDHPRPGHADFTAGIKFGGFQDFRGGGHFSGRITLGLVTAGVVAKKILKDVDIRAKLISAGGNPMIEEAVDEALKSGDSIGGLVECRINGIPAGIGEPFFDSVESLLAHILFAIPAVKGVEFGSGFDSAKMKGSMHNDVFISTLGKTATNHAGGINGGITNGNELLFRIAVKPTSSIAIPRETMNMASGKMESLNIGGRHDACIALRVPPVAEAAAAVVLADLMLLEGKIERIYQTK